MRSLLRYIIVGLLFVMPGEYLNQVIVHRAARNYALTIGIYAVLLVFGYVVRAITRRIIPRRVELLFTVITFGTLGLMIEWFMLGNAPWVNPTAVQSSMFAWWAGVFVLPRLFLEEDASFARLKRWLTVYHVCFSAFFLAIPLLVPGQGGVWLSVAAFSYGLLCYAVPEAWYVVRVTRS